MTRFFLLVASACALFGTAQAQVVYRETFYSANGGTAGSAGWRVDASGATQGSNVATNLSLAVVSNVAGRTANLTAINAGSYANTDLGLVFIDGGTYRQSLFFTTEYVGTNTLVSQAISQVSFYSGNAQSAQTEQVAIRVDAQWYVSTASFSNTAMTGAQFANDAVPQALSFAGAMWNALNYADGSPFVVSSNAVALPNGQVTAFGLFLDGHAAPSGNLRFDTFEITTVPEPATYVFLMGAGSLLVAGCARRGRPAQNSR
jgi:hypothetical protein